MRVVVSSVVEIPRDLVDVAIHKEKLTVKQWKMADLWDKEDKEPTKVKGYWIDKNLLYVPRAYGLQLIAKNGWEYDDAMSDGYKASFPKKVRHTGKYAYQEDFVRQIVETAKRKTDFLVHAATGKGKTVCSLSAAQRIGRTTLVVVDQENLKDQWIEEAKEHLGLDDDDIGLVQGKVVDYEGKPLVIAMMQSLVNKEYPEDFYDYFGTVIIDETHTAAAPTFSQSLMMFSARVRFGVSATIDRRDALQKLLHFNLGNVEVSLLDKHDASYAYYIVSDSVYSWYANISPKSGRMIAEIEADGYYNNLLVEGIKQLYESGRDILVISDRIEQLENLMAMAYYSGIPEQDMGVYCGSKNVWGYSKDPKPKRRPYGYERGSEYTPVKFGHIKKKMGKRDKQEQQRIKEESRIIFSTYGMFQKGVDEPRLSAGIDATPRSRAEQVHGRILRKKEGKHIPIWVTIRSINSYKLEHQFLQRIQEYVASSAEIYEWHLTKGVRLVDVKELKRSVRENIQELKQMNISMNAVGNYMLVTQTTQTDRGDRRERRTARATR
jgi:superfamily II DNA or RNA helicase